MTDDLAQSEASRDERLRAELIVALDYEEDDQRPLPDLVTAVIAEVDSANRVVSATRQMSIDASAALRAQLLAALSQEDDGRTPLPGYVAALIAELANARELRNVLSGHLADALDRAEKAEATVELMRPVVEAVREMVAKRNEHHGKPDNPDWWSGWDFKVVAAVDTYETQERTDG
jgi:hypothetical protein